MDMSLLEELNRVYQIDSLDLDTINLEISPNDSMFLGDRDKHHYFNVGFSALKNIILSLSITARDKHSIRTILDFPSGYGRVLRFLRAYFPKALITVSELNTDAVASLQSQFDVSVLNTQTDFNKIHIDYKFDLIWCGSLITHLSPNKTSDLLDFFTRTLNDDGILIFSSHGRFSSKLLGNEEKARNYYGYGMDNKLRKVLLKQYQSTGYGYVNYIGTSDYGMSVIKPSWFIKRFESDDRFKIVMYAEKAWDNHHDIVVCVKTPV